MFAHGPSRASNTRQSQIVALLRQAGRVEVEDLASQFGVAVQTIRRDLNELSKARRVARVHGGAIVASGVENSSYEARQHVAHPHKRLIGEAAARLIPDNSSLFINIGTTTEEVAKALVGHSGLLVITNNLHVANELYRNKAIEVFVTGGTIRQRDGGVVGAVTVSQIEQFRVDIAVVGTSAIDQNGTLLDFDIREVEISRAIIEHGRRVFLVADSSKFSRTAPVRIAHLSEIDILITDRLPSLDLRSKRQQLLSFLLRHSRIYGGGRSLDAGAPAQVADQKFENAAQQIVFQEGIDAIEDALQRLRCLEKQLALMVPEWSMAPVVEAYQVIRGASFLVAVTFAAEIGDVRRFDTPRQLMSFLGLVPAESSTGDTIRRKDLTLAGNRRARRALVEAAWTYRYPPRVSDTLRAHLEGLPKAVRDIAWKAQVRLCARYRRLSATGKKLANASERPRACGE